MLGICQEGHYCYKLLTFPVSCVPFQLWKIVAGAAGAWLNASQARSRTADMRSFQVTLLSLLVFIQG